MNTMREKLWFLYLAALAALYLPPRGCGIRPGQWPKREIFSWRKWFMGSRQSNSWVNNVPGASSEVCRAALASTGNKSPSVPRMKEASQVSQSKHGDSAACRSDWNMTGFLLGCLSRLLRNRRKCTPWVDRLPPRVMLQLGWATATNKNREHPGGSFWNYHGYCK